MFAMWFTSKLRHKIRHAGPARRPSQGARCRPRLELLEDRSLPSTFLVTNTGDNNGVNPAPNAGTGTLRQAIIDANAHAGADVIDFTIGSGVQTIQVGGATGSALPIIADSVTIDGTSQPGYSGIPLIELDGENAGANASGLVLAGPNCTVQGLVINRFSRFGIDLHTSSNVIQGNYVGVDATGNTLRADVGGGVVAQAAGNTIGGTAAGAGNVIGDGILLASADGTIIQGNTVGLGADGTTVLDNDAYGIYVFQSRNVVIGGDTAAARNIISGNFEFGIITSLVADGLVVQGNYIGTDRTGELARPNTYVGIDTYSNDVLIGGLTATPGTGAGNVIAGNGSGPLSGLGIGFSGNGPGDGDFVEGNIIGLDAGGTTALNNFQSGGVSSGMPNVTIGGTAAGARNVISGNGTGVTMVTLGNTGDVVVGNYIGTDVSGTHAAANQYGVVIYGGASGSTIGDTTAAARNVISGNSTDGVLIDSPGTTGNVVEGNFIGTDASGNTALGNGSGIVVQSQGNTIGGTTPGAGNVISGNNGVNGAGIILANAGATVIQGNTIGLGADGTTKLGSAGLGIALRSSQHVVIGGQTAAARNVISGNAVFGIEDEGGSDGLIVQGNYIGIDRSGELARGNTYIGIFIDSPGALIGGLTDTPGTGPGNVIAGNGSGPDNGGGIAFSDLGSGGGVQGNIIGLDAGGTTPLGDLEVGIQISGQDNLIGGTAAGARNVISGGLEGIAIESVSNTLGATGNGIQGNYIGTDITGTRAAGNWLGVEIFATSDPRVLGASGNTIGGTTAGAGNEIAFNRNEGVVIYGLPVTDGMPSTGNSIRGNSIHDNGGLGIDLGGNGVTLNDSAGHIGPNNYQNFPVVTNVTLSGGLTQVSGQLDSTPNTTFTVDFYANTLPDPTGYGEGQTYLGSWSVTTDGGGHADFTATVAAAPAGQMFLSATATDPGHNTSEFSASTLIAPSSLSGMVFVDFNNDGQVDFGEQAIAGVTITLAGTDDLGRPVNRSQQTDADGAYFIGNLLPGSYTLTETQPAGYTQGVDSVGTAGGSLVATDQFFVQLGQGVDGMNYNYGERPPPGSSVGTGQTATIGFWNNKRGQALILALNGGSCSTQLADWLAATLPNIYGAGAGGRDLTGKTNADVAALFQNDFAQRGPKLEAQVLATALAVYVTNATLDPTQVAAQYGFTVSSDGVGTATVSVGSNGDAFGVANNTTMTVMDLLLASNDQTVNGVLYNGDTNLRSEANNLFSVLNAAGKI
jgi:titin